MFSVPINKILIIFIAETQFTSLYVICIHACYMYTYSNIN